MSKRVYEELLKLRRWPIFIAIIIVGALPLVMPIIEGSDATNPIGNDIWFPIGLIMVVFVVFFFINMKLHFDEEVFSVKYGFRKRKIEWSAVANYEIKKYRPFTKQAFKANSKKNSYILNGRQVLCLELKSGETIMIETGKKDELEAFLSRMERVNKEGD
jgi:hypothetical protein